MPRQGLRGRAGIRRGLNPACRHAGYAGPAYNLQGVEGRVKCADTVARETALDNLIKKVGNFTQEDRQIGR